MTGKRKTGPSAELEQYGDPRGMRPHPNLKAAIKVIGISNAEFARLMGYKGGSGRQRVSYWITGNPNRPEYYFSDADLVRASDVLNVSIPYLLGLGPANDLEADEGTWDTIADGYATARGLVEAEAAHAEKHMHSMECIWDAYLDSKEDEYRYEMLQSIKENADLRDLAHTIEAAGAYIADKCQGPQLMALGSISGFVKEACHSRRERAEMLAWQQKRYKRLLFWW